MGLPDLLTDVNIPSICKFMDCDEKQNLIVALLALCGFLLVIVLAIIAFVLRARIKRSSRSQRKEDAISVTSVEIQGWTGPKGENIYESAREDEGTDYES